jgi:hypothetical protein
VTVRQKENSASIFALAHETLEGERREKKVTSSAKHVHVSVCHSSHAVVRLVAHK